MESATKTIKKKQIGGTNKEWWTRLGKKKKKKRNGFRIGILKDRDGLLVTDGVSVFLCLWIRLSVLVIFLWFFWCLFSGSLFSLHCPIICWLLCFSSWWGYIWGGRRLGILSFFQDPHQKPHQTYRVPVFLHFWVYLKLWRIISFLSGFSSCPHGHTVL